MEQTGHCPQNSAGISPNYRLSALAEGINVHPESGRD